MGLCCLLTGCSSYDEAIKLASEGDSTKVTITGDESVDGMNHLSPLNRLINWFETSTVVITRDLVCPVISSLAGNQQSKQSTVCIDK